MGTGVDPTAEVNPVAGARGDEHVIRRTYSGRGRERFRWTRFLIHSLEIPSAGVARITGQSGRYVVRYYRWFVVSNFVCDAHAYRGCKYSLFHFFVHSVVFVGGNKNIE